MRISFITLFGSLLVVFLSYVIRNYGLFVQALLEIVSAFAAIYVVSVVLKRTKYAWLWFFGFIILGLVTYFSRLYVPVITIFLLALGGISLAIVVLLVPFIIVKNSIGHIRKRHVDRIDKDGTASRRVLAITVTNKKFTYDTNSRS